MSCSGDIELEKQLPKTDLRNKVRELTLILADKIVDRKILDELWDELYISSTGQKC